MYLGEINHRDKSYPGEHEPIISVDLFAAVQSIRSDGGSRKRNGYERSGAMLAGLIYDDKDNRMTPVHVKKGSVRYHYYQSWVLAQGQKARAGSVYRVPAGEIERVVAEAVLKHIEIVPGSTSNDVAAELVRTSVEKIVVHQDHLIVRLHTTEFESSEIDQPDDHSRTESLTIAWSKPLATRKHQVLGDHEPAATTRPIRSEARTRLLKAVTQGRCWLDKLTSGEAMDIAELAAMHQISEKTVRSTLSLAFLAPDIVQAAIDGKLPRGLGVSQMTDLPADWILQRQRFGLG